MQEREAGIRICHSLQKTFLLFGFSASRCQVVIPLKSGIQKAAIRVSRLCLFDWIPHFCGMTTTDCLDCSRVGTLS